MNNRQRVQRVAMFLAGTLNGYGLAKGWGLWGLLFGATLYLAGTLVSTFGKAPEA